MAEPPRIPPPDEMRYEAAEWDHQRRGMRLSLAEKLRWLEEAAAFARRVQESSRGYAPRLNAPGAGRDEPGRTG